MRKILIGLLCFGLLCPCKASAAEGPKYIALTFDDGPSGQYTRRLLEGLAERGAKATFFLCGYRVEQYPDLAERIWKEGHEIGIHGYSHRDMRPMSRRDIAAEIQKTRALLPPKCPIKLLRPPGGCCSDGVYQVAEALGLAVVGWSLDPKDWASRDTAAVGSLILDRARDGDIVLMHDMSSSSVAAALQVVDRLKSRGFTFVTVSELARLRGVKPVPGKAYRYFPG